jgi:hypothetical protein
MHYVEIKHKNSRVKVREGKVIPVQAVEALRLARCRGSHIFIKTQGGELFYFSLSSGNLKLKIL